MIVLIYVLVALALQPVIYCQVTQCDQTLDDSFVPWFLAIFWPFYLLGYALYHIKKTNLGRRLVELYRRYETWVHTRYARGND